MIDIKEILNTGYISSALMIIIILLMIIAFKKDVKKVN